MIIFRRGITILLCLLLPGLLGHWGGLREDSHYGRGDPLDQEQVLTEQVPACERRACFYKHGREDLLHHGPGQRLFPFPRCIQMAVATPEIAL